MKTIGLVGGVASGKSLAARMLVDLGAGLLDADRTGHAVLAEDAEVQEVLRQRWGESVFTAAGSVDRAAVAKRVFAADDAASADREFLENLLHPRIRRRLETQQKAFVAENRPAVVLDAPLILEAGWAPMCDVILMIDAPRDRRLQWARGRGWTEAEFARREAAQWPVEQKRRGAQVFIANDGTTEDLHHAVRKFWEDSVSADGTGG
jgi:dephospho-CoA kinase